MGEMINSKMNSSDHSLAYLRKLEQSYAWKLNQEQLTIYETEIRKRIPEVKGLLNEEIRKLKGPPQ